MCGIAGFLTSTDTAPSAYARIHAMTQTLVHRGPDSEGTWVDPAAGIALGHRRLAVVDLSAAGNQPMMSASGRFALVFNGEIYNFMDLRKELERLGGGSAPEFQGHSDTEVMLACFEQWGVLDSLPRFNGMFAFAVWDRRERSLHLARDPIGEKPLYYGWAGNTLLFGSELKALRAHPDCPYEIDHAVLARYLEDCCVPAPFSIYKNIFKLMPGTVLTVHGNSRRAESVPYWSFQEKAKRGLANLFDGSDEEAENQLERLLAEATRMRMLADVPLGAFLSGGIDSSLIVSLMQSQSSKPVKTFTIGFHEGEYNEAAAAKKVAEHLRTDHTEWYITPKEAQAVVPRLPLLYDEPFADVSQIPTFLVSSLARQHVTVSLSGDGGDELFGGYSRYARISGQWERLARVPHLLRTAVAGVLAPIAADKGGILAAAGLALLPSHLSRHKLQKLAALAPSANQKAFYDAYHCRWWGRPPVADGGHVLTAPTGMDNASLGGADFLHQMMAVDTLNYLPDDILVKVDRASMGVSLESRIPLLDPRVVEFAWRLPLRAKVRDGQTKWILHKILHRYVPPALVERPKVGFGVPIGRWLRGPLREWAEELLNAGKLKEAGYLASGPVRRRWSEHLAGVEDHSDSLWPVLMFQSWIASETRPAPLPEPGFSSAVVKVKSGQIETAALAKQRFAASPELE